MVVLQHTFRVRKVSLVLVNPFRPSGGPSRLHKVWKPQHLLMLPKDTVFVRHSAVTLLHGNVMFWYNKGHSSCHVCCSCTPITVSLVPVLQLQYPSSIKT